MEVSRLNGKAVSEILGYILVLSVVVATITVIYAAGMPAIRSQQDIAVFRSMENTFYVLQNVERLVAYNITPEKSVSVRVEEGSIAVIPDWGWINITIKQGPVPPTTIKYGVIVYISKNNKAIILDNGAIIECYGDRCYMVSNPRILKWNNSTTCNLYISVINVSGDLSFTGYKSITFKNTNSIIMQPTTKSKAQTVNITINIVGADKLGLNATAIEEAWVNYLKSIGGQEIWAGPGKSAKFDYKNISIIVGCYNITVSG